jgi:signal transduction histidine kinase/HAMP domain-containing protein
MLLNHLRCRLILLVLMAVIPAFALISYSAAKHRKIAVKQVTDNALATVRTIADDQERALANAHQFLVTLARVPQIRGADKAACGSVLAGLLEPIYADLILADRHGNRICTAVPPSHSVAAPNGSHQRRALETYGFSIGQIRNSPINGKMVLDLAYPIAPSEGAVRGVLSAALDLSWIMRASMDGKVSPAMTFSFIDDNGIVLLQHPQNSEITGKPIFSEYSNEPIVLREHQHTATREGADGMERLFAFHRLRYQINGRTVYAVIDIPMDAAFAETKRIFLIDLMVLGVLSLLVLAAAWFGADVVVLRRIRDIIATTREVAAGKLNARTTLPYGQSELGQLARAFDDLTVSLETRNAEMSHAAAQIQRQQQQQNTLYQLNRELTSTLELNRVLRTLVHHASAFYPQSIVTVNLMSKQGSLEPMIPAGNVDQDGLYADLAAHQTLPAMVRRRQSPLIVANIQHDTRSDNHDFYRRNNLFSYLGLPLTANNTILGVVSFYTREQREFGPEELSFLNTVVNEGAIALYNSQLFGQTLEQSIELEKSNKIKDEFLGVMSHELRTPLNIIMNYVEVLKMESFGELTSEQASGLDKIASHSRHLLSLINGILEITKIEGGTLAVQEETVNLVEFMNECQSDYVIPSDKNLHIEWNYPTDLPSISVDRMKLKQILSNLIGNAIKFTEAGTVLVAAKLLQPQPVFEIKVADSGSGIPSEDLDRIFEKFRQVDSATTRNHSGAGLGLYIVKTFVDLFQGTIGVESKLGEGSVFTVRLPIKPAPCEDDADRLL